MATLILAQYILMPMHNTASILTADAGLDLRWILYHWQTR